MSNMNRAQLSYGDESSYGVYEAPTISVPFTGSESLTKNKEQVRAQGRRANMPYNQLLVSGKEYCDGSVSFEFGANGFGTLLKHAIGHDSTTGSDPYTHVYVPTANTLDGQSLSLQITRSEPGVSGPQVFSYKGGKVLSGEFMAENDSYLMLNLDFWFQDETLDESEISEAYNSDPELFLFLTSTVTFGGATPVEIPVKSFKVSWDNDLNTDRYFMQSTNPALGKEPLEGGNKTVSGEFVAEFDQSIYQYFQDYTACSFNANFDNGADASMDIDIASCRLISAPVTNQSSSGLIEVTYSFESYVAYGQTESDALQVTLVNSTSSV